MTFLLTALALITFAGNSILCRLALGTNSIGPSEFTALRLFSGALALWILLSISRGQWKGGKDGSWTSALALFSYAAAFSFAYVTLGAGTGALILFASVQFTMLVTGLYRGERLRILQWTGFVMAFGGLVYLVLPGLKAPSPGGCALMTLAGIAWGVYSLRGRGVTDPIAVTADNFARSAPFALALLGLMMPHGIHATASGVMWALTSGIVTSGLGYAIWYFALRGMTATLAAVAQLSVPALAALGGILLLGETPSFRLLFSAIATLGGVGLSVSARK